MAYINKILLSTPGIFNGGGVGGVEGRGAKRVNIFKKSE